MEKLYTLIFFCIIIVIPPKIVFVIDVEMERVLSADASIIEDTQATIVVVGESEGVVDIRL